MNQTVMLHYRDSFTKVVVKNVIVVLLGIFINCINASLIHTFHRHQILYTNPRYILFIHLVINDMLQLLLTILLFLISYTLYRINTSVCCAIILVTLITTENTPLNLACMAIECYIAVCIPLRHVQICTIRRTMVLIGFIWLTTFLSAISDLLFTLATQPLDFFYSKIFCIRKTVFSHPIIVKKRDTMYLVYLVIVWMVISFLYLKILCTAKSACKEIEKARNTILLNGFQLLLCTTSYAAPQLISSLRNSTDITFIYYVIVQILPRSISPIIYGVRDNTFRKYLKRYFLKVLSRKCPDM